ncbi:acetylxylan esterase [Georgenia sp. SUBG003]|uniref:acetylxylan esterase n=1 Tax=Georgenia sp. SUBG003 TaxID=1497974 RepID=UPI003AB867E0
MPLYDLPLAELETYRPEVPEPEDFDGFWARTLAEARTVEVDVRLARVDTGAEARGDLRRHLRRRSRRG